MERRRRLADLLAVPAGELLAHVLDHLPLARDHLQRLGDVLAQLATAARRRSSRRPSARHDHPLARQMLGERLARRPLAGERRHRSWSWPRPSRRRARPRSPALQLLELQLQLIEQPRRAFRARAVELALQLRDLQLLVRDQRLVVGLLSARRRRPPRARRSSAAFSASMSSGRASRPASMTLMESQNQRFAATFFRTSELF